MDVNGLFLRGKEAADGGNYEYAIAIFLDILRAHPDHRNSRVALRGCEMEQFRERGGGAMAKLTGFFKGLGPLVTMNLCIGKPAKAMDHCERYLVNNPTSIRVLMRLARACEKLGHLDAAADTLEFARQRRPQHMAVLRHLGEVQRQRGDYEKSVRCFQEILRLRPQDRDAAERVKNISAESHLKRSHLEEAESFRESLRDGETAEALEKEIRLARSDDEKGSEIAKFQKAVEANPEDAKAQSDLGDACSRAEQFREAEAAYRKAFELSKRYNDREKLGTARLRYLQQVERKATREAEEGDHAPHLIAKARQAREQRVEFAVKEFEFRRKNHPTDMNLAWNLGNFYVEAGGDENISKAMQQFQQAMSSPGLKIQAQRMLGHCFAMNPKTLDMAKEQYQKALEQVDDPRMEMGKTLMYELGSIDEKLGNTAEAVTWYKKIFAVDAGFKDVGKKVQTLG